MKPYMIIIDGPMGSGKTTLATLLNTKLKRTANVNIDRIKFFVSDFERNTEDNAMTSFVLMKMIEGYIKQGINVMIAQGFYRKEHLDPYIKFAKKNKLRLYMYQLEAPKALLLERLAKRPKPVDAKTPVSKTRIMKNLKSWSDNRQAFGKVFDTNKASIDKIAKEILKDVKDSI